MIKIKPMLIMDIRTALKKNKALKSILLFIHKNQNLAFETLFRKIGVEFDDTDIMFFYRTLITLTKMDLIKPHYDDDIEDVHDEMYLYRYTTTAKGNLVVKELIKQ